MLLGQQVVVALGGHVHNIFLTVLKSVLLLLLITKLISLYFQSQ
jgi:hypothetical protein